MKPMPDDFDDPATASPLDLNQMLAHLLLVEVEGQEIDMPTVNGKASPIRATVHDLDTSETHPDALIFPRVLISQLRPRIGGMVLGRLGQQPAKPGKSPAWELTAPTDPDRAKARAFRDRQAAPTAAAPAASADDIPPF